MGITHRAAVFADDEKPDTQTVASVEEATPPYASDADDTGGGASGGGSAFAHLTEDTDNAWIAADWPIHAPGALIGNPASAAVEFDGGGVNFWGNFASDDYAQFLVDPTDGSLHWGDGTAAPDVDLGRIAAGNIGTTGAANQIAAQQLADGSTGYAAISAEGFAYAQDGSGNYWTLHATGVFEANNPFVSDTGFAGAEMADPTAPAANSGILYFKDVGGKTALVAQFPTGAVQQVAIEP